MNIKVAAFTVSEKSINIRISFVETAETAGSYRSVDEEETLGEHQPNHKANGIADGDNDIRQTKSSPKRFAGKKETIALRPLTMPKRGTCSMPWYYKSYIP